MSTVTEAWNGITVWLESNAPKIVSNLNPPASDVEIQDAESAIGCEMPSDWRDLYRVHNGMNSDSNMGSLFYGMQFLSLSEAIREREENAVPTFDVLPVRAADPGIRTEDIYNPKWIAFAHDGGETLIRVDMDPASTGKAGQVIFTDHADDTVIHLNDSIAEFMLQFLRHLEDGRYFLNEDALADGDHFLACDSEIDVVNWSFASRWKHLAQ